MKTKFYIIIAIAATLIMSSCEYYPESDFYASSDDVAVNERIYFTNMSDNADEYEWDFGDGTVSFNYDASHTYEAPGSYTVTLYAFKDDQESSSTMRISVYEEIIPPVSNAQVSFTPDDVITDIGYSLFFRNTSSNVDEVRWYFGDGSQSSVFSPSHDYADYGVYTVTLQAWDNGVYIGSVSQNIEVNPTSLEITVVEYQDEYIVPDASIILYPTYSDWVDQTNMIEEQYSNDNGTARFNFLSARSYYLDVWHPNHNNYILANDDLDFIRTLPLLPGYNNTFVAFVDFVPSEGKAQAREKAAEQKLKIVDIKRIYADKLKAYKTKQEN